MEISEVKRRVVEAVGRAKRHASERRSRVDEASKAYGAFLDQRAVPVFKQVANVLRAEGYPFNVYTPGGSVRLTTDRGADDYIELTLDATDDVPSVTLRARRSRGSRVVESIRAIGDPATLAEDDVLAAVLQELEPFVER
jgi:hypothetical protein